jgi:hypothetical protein
MRFFPLARASAFRSVLFLVVIAAANSVVAATKPASGPMPKISVAGIRVVGSGVGANGSELHAFNERPGIAVGLAIEAPAGSGIVEIDDDTSRVDLFTDNKGTNLLEEGRFGPFPKISEDRAAGLVEVEVRGRPSASASSVRVQGSVAMSVAGGTKPTRVANVRLEPGRTMKVGNVNIAIKTVTPGDESTDLGVGLPRSFMNTISAVRFYDAKGELIESHRTSSGYMNDAGEMNFDLKSKDKVVSAEFDLWQNIRQIKAPFNLTVGLGLSGDRSAPTTAAAAAPSAPPAPISIRRDETPKTAPAPNDGAASVDAVVSQMNAGYASAKGRDLLALVYPDDRANFGVEMAMAVVFSTMTNMSDTKASEKAQNEVDALIAKHKLNMPLSKPPAEIFKNADLAAFISDAVSYLKTHMPKEAGAFPPKDKAQNVRIDGDSAVATVGKRDMKFGRVNGKWFAHFSE